ncbi:MAG TPA: T9SS type A sorting domain-containing protein [Ignavibacteria bacterium]|nr:T9SS type A sorting domain-containing protein [Ignavibacteria bacterium]
MKNLLPQMRKAFSLLLLLVIGVSISFVVYAQVDDPNLDQIPMHFRNMYQPSIIEDALPPVTIGDYDNFNLGVDFAEGHIVVNPLAPTQFFTSFNINATWHTEDGWSWTRNNPTFPNQAGDPINAYDSLGRLYYDNMKSPITGTWNVYSTNNGLTWAAAVTANIGNDKNWIAADQTSGPYTNYVYGVMTPGNVVRSTDRGVSFQQVFNTSNTLPGMMVAVGPNKNTNVSGGAVYVVSNTGSTFAPQYNFFLSTNGGTNFAPVSTGNRWVDTVGIARASRHTVDSMRTRPYPMIGADNSWGPYRGRVYVIHAGNPGSSNKPDIWCRYSDNMGANWSARIRVNDNPLNTSDQWHPAMWVDTKTGYVYAQWMDSRDSPSGDHAHIYASMSTNGGVNWVPNVKISNAPMKIRCTTCGGGGAPATYQGDYNSITSNGEVSMLAWADFRAGNFATYTAYFPDFGMRVTPSSDSLNPNNGNITINVQIPSVKLYSNTVTFTASVAPTPGGGTLSATFPSGNTVNTAGGSGSVPMRITATGGVTPGTYIVTVTGKGPNGTPVHKRDVTVYVANTVTNIGGDTEIPLKWDLSQNFPNPFNPTTRINFSVLEKSDVKISIYNSVGKEVSVYSMKQRDPGNYFVTFNAGALPSGVYFYKLESANFTDTKKMLLVK